MLHLLLFALVTTAPQDKLDPAKHPWMKWKAGAWVKYNISQQAGDQKAEGTALGTLTKVTDADYTVAMKYEIGGQTIEEEEIETIPVKDGTETLTVAGKKYECTIWKSSSTKGEKKTEFRVWATNTDYRILKMIAKGDSTFDVTAVAMTETLELCGKKYDCMRLEGNVSEQGHDGKMICWITDGIPGGWAKMEQKFSGELEVAVTMELAEFKTEGK